MRSTCSGTLGALFAICMALPASAEDNAGKPAPDPATRMHTGKERLGRKWMDEQRIDNCQVAPERRGAVARPDCEAAPTTAAPAQPPASTGQAAR